MAGNKSSEPTNPSDPSKNLEAAQKMSEALENAKTSAKRLSDEFTNQLRTTQQLSLAIGQMSESLQAAAGISAQASGMLSPGTWEEVEKAIKKTQKSTEQFKGAAQKLSKYLKSDFEIACNVGKKAVEGLGQGFRNFFALIKGAGGLIETALGAVFDLAKAIIAIPFKIISDLFEMSKKPGDTALAQAIEDVRKEFGSLRSDSSRTILDVAKNMGKLDSTGVSAFSVFGNLAERIKAVQELAMGMGAAFQVFGKEVMENGEAIMRYNKGLGITNEQMGGITSTALRMGKDIAQVQNEMTKQALGMSKAFGVNAKVISKDMAKAMADLAHFGHLSTKEIAIAATFANKLGISVDKLTGILDATKTFDQTAESVSRLNEQFHTNIDAQKLMLAETPQEQLEMLRSEFSRAGVDVSKLNRFQRELIKSTGLMTDETMNAALSSKNASVSLDKMQRQGDKNENSVMTQTEAMRALADSMERLIKQGETTKGGILDHLLEGFSRGIQQSPEFIKLMTNMRGVLQEALMAGVKLGRKFVEVFPGIKDIFSGLADLFDPARWQKMFNKVINAFDIFKTGGVDKFDDFMEEIKKIFLNFFDESTPAGKQVIEGFKKFGQALVGIFGKISEWIITKLADIVVDITKWLSDPKMPGDVKGLTGSLMNPFDKAIAALKTKLLPALGDLLKVVGNKLMSLFKEHVYPYLPEIGLAIGAIILGPAFLKGLMAGASGALGNVFIKFLSSKVLGAGDEVKKAVDTISKAPAAPEMASKVGSPDDISKVTKSGAASEQANKVNWGKVKTFLVTFAGVLLIGMAAVLIAVAAIRLFDVKPLELGMALASVLAVSVAALPIAAALWLVSKVPQGEVMKGAVTIGLMMTAMVVALGAVVFLAKLADGADNMLKATASLLAMEAVFGAAAVLATAAAVIGALISGPQGAIIAAAIAGGLATLGAVIAAMASTVVGIMKTLNEMTVQEGFKDKIDAFVKIMDAITNFSKNISAILNAIRPSLISVIRRGDDTVKRIDAVTKMIEALIGQKGGTGIIGLIELISETMRSLSREGPHVVEGAKALAAVLSAIAALAGALKPPDKLFEAVADGKRREGDVDSALRYVKDFSNAQMDNIKGILDVFDKKIKPLISRGFDTKQIEAAAGLAQVINSIANLSQSLGPSAEKLRELKAPPASENVVENIIKTVTIPGQILAAPSKVLGAFGVQSAEQKTEIQKLEKLKENTKASADGLKDLVSGLSPAMESLGKGLAGVKFDQHTAEGVKALVPLIMGMLEFTRAIFHQGTVLIRDVPQGGQGALMTAVTQTLRVLPDVFKTLGEGLPKIIDGMESSIAKLSASTKPEELKKGVEALKYILDAASGVMKVATELGTTSSGNTENIVVLFNAAAGLMEKLILGENSSSLMSSASTGPTGWANSPIGKIANALSTPELQSSADKIKKGFEVIKEVTSFVKEMMEFAKSKAGGVEGASGLAIVYQNMETMFGKKGTNDGTPLSNIAGLFSDTDKMKLLDQLIEKKPTVDKLKEFFDSSTNLAFSGKGLVDSAGKIREGIVGAIDTVKEMVTKANELNNLLNSGLLKDVDFDAKLKTLAQNVGIGGNFKYTVDNKEVVINLNLNVTMDAGAVEKVVVFRKESIIRDRLNYLLGSGQGADVVAPETRSLRTNEQSPTRIAQSVD